MDFFKELQPYSPLFQIAAIFIALAALYFNSGSWRFNKWKQQRDDYIARFKAQADIDLELQALAAHSIVDTYRGALDTLNAGLQKFFGAPGGWRAFDRCLLIAFFYPLGLFVLAWIFGALGKIGEISILEKIDQFHERLLRSLLMLVTLSLVSLMIWNSKAWISVTANMISAVTSKFFLKFHSNYTILAVKNLVQFTGIAIIICIQVVLISVMGLVGLYSIFTPNIDSIFVVAVVIGVLLYRRFNGLKILCATLSLYGFSALLGGSLNYGISLAMTSVFFIMLPIANAVLDFFSWLATRILIKRMAMPGSGGLAAFAVLGHIVLDLAIACACLIALAIMMAVLLELANLFLAWKNWPLIDWRGQINAAMGKPVWDPNTWTILGMLASTVAPTALHISYGLAAVMLAFHPDMEKAKALLQNGVKMTEGQKQEAAAMLVQLDKWRGITRILMFAALLLGLMFLLYLGAGMSVGKLADIAFWAGDLIRR